MNERSFVPTPADFEQEFVFEGRAAEPDASEWELSAPGTATVSRSCPQKAGTAKDRCSSPRPCPAIPDLRCLTRVSGIPFHYVAGVGRDAATNLRRVTKRQEGRTQRMVPRAIAALEAFVRNARSFGLPFDTILTMGSLYCRCVRGSNPPALSNHSFGDAIDIAGVRWVASGGPSSRVRETIVHNFCDPGQRALLRRLNACLRLSFATVIDYHRADHHDHFHCDTNQGRGRITRGTATLRFVQEALGAVLGRTVKITGKLDAATKKALLDYSKKGPEIFKSNKQLNEVFDRLFRQVASGKGNGQAVQGELDFEFVGGIPVEDYLRWVQGSLNLYFEMKGRSERIKANGEDSAEYRTAVQLFKSLAKVSPVNGTVDEKTQNALIKANESNPKYLSWLKSALNKAGYAHLTIAYEKHEKPVAVIREFQRDYSGHFGFTLYDDGFVGAKTHLALLHATRPVKPKPPKPEEPIEVTEEQLHYQLSRAEEWIREYEDPDQRPTELCLIAKLKRENTDDRFMTSKSVHKFFGAKLGTEGKLFLSARRTLKAFLKGRRLTNRPVTPEDMVASLQCLVHDLVDGVRALQFSYCYDPRLPGIQKEIRDLARRRDSLYSCPNVKRLVDTMKQCAG